MCVFMVHSRVKTENESEVEAAIEREWLEVFPLDPETRMSFESRARKGKNAIFFGGGH